VAEPEERPAESDVYARLAAPFDTTFRDNRGGVELEYVTGEQVVSRLCDVLGLANWSFRVVEHGLNAEADEMWVLGEMTADVDGKTVTRQQFGSQKLKRSRSSGAPLDIGFDLKGAATDSLKKCSSLLGVGLYLSKKESLPAHASNGQSGASYGAGMQQSPVELSGVAPACEDCGTELKETRFKDGTVWGPAQLAGYGRRKHGKVLCMDHYRAANEARRASLLSA
jgi:hypothetical protein